MLGGGERYGACEDEKERWLSRRWQPAVRTIFAAILMLESLWCFSVRCRYAVKLANYASPVQAARQRCIWLAADSDHCRVLCYFWVLPVRIEEMS